MSLTIFQHCPGTLEARRPRNLILPPLLQSTGRWLYLRTLLAGFALLLFLPGSPLLGQQFKTRAEEIEQARRDKRARLWRETESPIVQKVNTLVERGLLDGVTSGMGSNGWQVVLGGTRSGQGMSVGLGYRRTDLFGDRLGFRTTFRGTPQLASLVDFELNFPKLETERVFVNFHAKYENSPQVDFYGKGPDSSQQDRTSYRLETVGFDFNAGYRIFRYLNAGVTGSFVSVHTGPGKRGGVPSTDEIFDFSSAPGLREDTNYLGVGRIHVLGFSRQSSRAAQRGALRSPGAAVFRSGCGEVQLSPDRLVSAAILSLLQQDPSYRPAGGCHLLLRE